MESWVCLAATVVIDYIHNSVSKENGLTLNNAAHNIRCIWGINRISEAAAKIMQMKLTSSFLGLAIISKAIDELQITQWHMPRKSRSFEAGCY